MEELLIRSQPGDVPVELIHRIQLLLPLKEAARTCVLSKTWSNAWSTIPNIRFDVTPMFCNEEKEKDYIQFMDRTISKYVQDNIPIESFDLRLTDIKLASVASNWLRTLAAQSCFKELSICICYEFNGKLILPDEIFSGKNLHTLSLRNYRIGPIEKISVSLNPVINCASLRVLELEDVEISEEVLDNLFSTCILLEKILLSVDSDLKTLNVKNLHYLLELKLSTIVPIDVLKIDDVPNLRLFDYYVVGGPIKTFNMASLTSVTELSLNRVTIDATFLDLIKSNLPSLEFWNLIFRTGLRKG
ncbi:putative F-box/FBD/LRR-repeat protein At5g62970 [Rutidosis leptorrhynchoides]|uniref:putative F-box/FBD/LRR-repeat protein At5g62970 n=1 Tax=Rutidosis leptorrhynchoides TaxID=125765 RepID=UPI003A9977DA